MNGLGTIMRQKYDPKYSEELEFEKQAEVSKVKMQAILKNKRKKLETKKPVHISAGELGV